MMLPVFSTRALNCKLPLESLLSQYLSKNKISHISTYLGRGGYLSYMPFQFSEANGRFDSFHYPLIVATLDNALQAAHNPLYTQPLK